MNFWKSSIKTFIKMQFHCIFRNKIISCVIGIWFSKSLSNKISLALILKRKYCICCRKHCRAYFHRHMKCAVLKSFWGCRELFRKSSCNIHFPIEEKFNLNRFISILYKINFAYGSAPSPTASCDTFPFGAVCYRQ